MIRSDSERAFGALRYLTNEGHPVQYYCKQPGERGVKVERCSLREEEVSCLSIVWNMQALTFGEAIFRLHQLLSKLRDLFQQFRRICQIHCAAFRKTDFIKLFVNKSKDENKLINRPGGSSWVFIPLTDIPAKATPREPSPCTSRGAHSSSGSSAYAWPIDKNNNTKLTSKTYFWKRNRSKPQKDSEQPLNINGRWKLGMMEPLMILGLVCPEGSYL